jgi:hypothetical protein
MYAATRRFAIRSPIRRPLTLVFGLGASVLLSGCIGNPFQDAKVDPNSPVAPEVARVARLKTDYPTFASIPAMPKDVRPVKQFGRAADAVEAARADLEQQTAPETWSLTDAEAYAAKARAAAGSEAPPAANGDTDAFINSQRKRATPPPPPPK